jgi:RNA polymerase sigma-70 factor (ECF subfamily)
MKENFSDEMMLLKALEKGNAKAYEYLMESFYNKLCVYANTLCHDDIQAEDIVQNVFLRLWKNKEKIGKIKKLHSFLYKSVYNEFIDQYRQSKQVITLEKKHIELLSNFLEEETDANLERLIKIVSNEIDNLPPKCKEVLLMSKNEGLTNLEISEFLKISIKSVEAHISKAYKILKDKTKNGYLFFFFHFNT